MSDRIWIIAFVCMVFSVAAAGQKTEENVTLPDDVMKQVVERILRFQFKPRQKSTRIPLSASLLKREWLPEITNIDFTLVPDEQVPDHEKGVFLFEGLGRDGNAYVIKAGWGDPGCFAEGTWWKFNIISVNVRLWPIGKWGRG